MRVLARIVLSVVLCSMLGCVNNSPTPDDDGSARSTGADYTVKRGDTLYSIAFRSGMDYRKVAAANGIVPPYTIYPGQLIFLNEGSPVTPISVSPPVVESRPAYPPAYPSTSAPAPKPVPVPAPSHGSSAVYTPAPIPESGQPVISAPPPVNPGLPAAGAPLPVAVSTPPPEPLPAPEVKKQPETDTFEGGVVTVWLWPTAGPVTRGYSESVHKGIDIGGARGDPVLAVAAGKVVYSGTGIVGFGELLIVKHNEEYLSAYGHNDRLLVTEGQTVTAGQVIAEKGSSGTDTVKLHFEIRREGKPIDPQRVLPRR
jgi:lipoprotein NlpD